MWLHDIVHPSTPELGSGCLTRSFRACRASSFTRMSWRHTLRRSRQPIMHLGERSSDCSVSKPVSASASKQPGASKHSRRLAPAWLLHGCLTIAIAAGFPQQNPERRRETSTRKQKEISGHRVNDVPRLHIVEVRGFEPLTFSMPWRRATNCAIPPCGWCSRERLYRWYSPATELQNPAGVSCATLKPGPPQRRVGRLRDVPVTGR